ncbi:MAG: hypothetical protein J1F20_07485 [Muribaculaceae bacterium]|nr:hypothetical protein [Muribaculaceae bacterium]
MKKFYFVLCSCLMFSSLSQAQLNDISNENNSIYSDTSEPTDDDEMEEMYQELVSRYLMVENFYQYTRINLEMAEDVYDFYSDRLDYVRWNLVELAVLIDMANGSDEFTEDFYNEMMRRLDFLEGELSYVAAKLDMIFENIFTHDEDVSKIAYLTDCLAQAYDYFVSINTFDIFFDYLREVGTSIDYMRYLVDIEWQRAIEYEDHYFTQVTDNDVDSILNQINRIVEDAIELSVEELPSESDITPISVFSVDGKPQDSLGKGLQIAVYPDGTVKKIFVR